MTAAIPIDQRLGVTTAIHSIHTLFASVEVEVSYTVAPSGLAAGKLVLESVRESEPDSWAHTPQVVPVPAVDL